MKHQDLVRKHFPYPKFNPGQEEAILQILDAFDRGATHVVADIPTGVGKSAIARTVHMVMKELNPSHRTTITTGTKGLQDQYVAEFPDIEDLRGKKNYSCIKKAGESYGTAFCKGQLATGGCSKDRCPYVKQRDKWRLDASIRVTNISFQINAPHSLIADEDSMPELVVLDECHELPIDLVDHNIMKINLEDFKHSTDRLGARFIGLITDFNQEFMHCVAGEAFIPTKDQVDVASKVQGLIDSAIEVLEKDKKAPEVLIEELSDISEKLRMFIASKGKGEWIMMDYAYGSRLELKPVYATLVAEPSVFSKGNKFLHMSATICGAIEYANSLGLPDTTALVQITSPIPKENRKIIPVCSVAVNRSTNIAVLAKEVDKIIDRYPGQNGVIHTVSFDLANKIQSMSKHKRKMLVSKDRREIMSYMKRRDVVLLSASVETGYDFKGDLANYQIIAKVPFGFIGDPYVKLNMGRDPKWYSREAVMRIVQASGRAVRGIDDHANTYILDQNFMRLLRQDAELFPEWYLEAIV